MTPPRLVLSLGGALWRLAILTYYIGELYSKTVSPGFAHWARVIGEAHMPAPAAELALVIVLLILGIVLTAVGTARALAAGVTFLMVYQIPTALIFENDYELLKSVSLVCAFAHIAVTAQPACAARAAAKAGSEAQPSLNEPLARDGAPACRSEG